MDYSREVLAIFHEFGLTSTHLVADGQIHRSGTSNKPNGKDGWYIVHPEWKFAVLGDWSSGSKVSWLPHGRQLSNQDKSLLKFARIAFEAEQKKAQLKAIDECHAIWKQSSPSTCKHSYILKKCIKPYISRVDHFKNLLIPICSFDGKLSSLQFISSNGTKRFKSGGRLKGCATLIGCVNKATPVLLCEGYATGCSLYEATSLPVVIAFNAGNLVDVCHSIKDHNSMLKIVICADNDHQTESENGHNVGLDKAKSVASKFNLPVIWPIFDKNSLGTDFNDIHFQYGLDGLKKILSPISEMGH